MSAVHVKQELLDSMDAAAESSAFGVVQAGLQASVVPGPSVALETQQSICTAATLGETQVETQAEGLNKKGKRIKTIQFDLKP